MRVQYLNIEHLNTSINNIVPTLKHLWSMGKSSGHYTVIPDFTS